MTNFEKMCKEYRENKRMIEELTKMNDALKADIMLATNALIDDLLNCEDVGFVDMVLTHIRDATPFYKDEIEQWDEKEE